MKPSIIPALDRPAIPANRALSTVESLGRKALLGALARITEGELRLIEPEGTHCFGRRTPDFDVAVTLEVLDPQLWANAAFGGTVGAGEAYIRGQWRATDVTALVRLFVRNRHMMEAMEGGLAFFSAPLRRLLHFVNRNSREGSQRNISAHYDLGNDLFKLFLDETMAYSAGIFTHADSTLHEASLAKFDALCLKLDLQPGDHLVEIGTGWGGLAAHAAERYGCRVTTTTISQQQYDYSKELVARRGLADRVTLLLEDYRDLKGTYDKLVSVEMVEAVGHQYLDTYLGTCSRLLKPHGLMALQAITLQDQFYKSALKNVDYIQRYVFPGSFIPSVTALVDAATRASDMKLTHLEDFGPHYATTLRHWRERFMARLDEVRALGYPDEFIRLWEYYLCYCEGGFTERQIGVVHMLLAKPRARRVALVTA
jgi:cyclopropane-fatty-acyl-phospholipid synthase